MSYHVNILCFYYYLLKSLEGKPFLSNDLRLFILSITKSKYKSQCISLLESKNSVTLLVVVNQLWFLFLWWCETALSMKSSCRMSRSSVECWSSEMVLVGWFFLVVVGLVIRSWMPQQSNALAFILRLSGG